MNADQKQFILKNYKTLSPRQLSKTLNLPRKTIEEYIRSQKNQKFEESPPISLKKEVWICFIIFAVALIVRLLYVHWLKSTPFFEPLTAPLKDKLDDGVYHQMALEMSRGSWIANSPLNAYRLPLYPYFLSILYSVFGHHISLVHYAQSLIGSFSVILVYLISKEVWKSVRIAVIGGAIAAFYVPFIFYENLLLGETLSIFLNLLSAFLLTKSLSLNRRVILMLIPAAIFMGLSILLRPNTLVVAFFAAAFLAYHGWKSKNIKTGLSYFAVFLMAAAITVSPLTVRNYLVYKDFIPISPIGGINLYIGNNPDANGKFNYVKGVGTNLEEMLANSEKIASQETGKKLKSSEVSSYWSRKAFRYLLSSPGHGIGLMFKKAALFFNRYELPDILDISFVAQFNPFLGLGSFQYGLVFASACAAVIFCYRRNNPGAGLIGIIGISYALSVMLFFITSRYRLPVVPFLIVYAAAAIGEGARYLSSNRTAFFKLLSAFFLAGLFTFWPVKKTDFGTNYNTLAISVKYKGDLEAAEKYYRKAIEISPGYPSPYYNLARLLDETGRHNDAIPLYGKFEALKKEL